MSRPSLVNSFQSRAMATSKFQLVFEAVAECGILNGKPIPQSVEPRVVSFRQNRITRCRSASASMRCYHPSGAYGYTLPVRASPSSKCYSKEALPDFSLSEDQLKIAVDSVQQENAVQGTLKLVAGSCYLPHPKKEETGGEDGHFICEDERVIGVADGVGGWASYGIDAGEYARALMSNAVSSIREDFMGEPVDPARILEKAHSVTRYPGSSTACIIALTEQGIHAINLGDSGFLVIRNGSIVLRSRAQQYEFNFPYQLGSDCKCDPPSSGEILKCPVQAGDVIVAGTDGLFDNLFNNEIIDIVAHATSAHLDPQVTAQKIVALARERAGDKKIDTPFSTGALEAGFFYRGGKLDDITVVVAYITSPTSE